MHEYVIACDYIYTDKVVEKTLPIAVVIRQLPLKWAMVTRNYGLQDLPSYSRLFQIESEDSGAVDIEDHHTLLKLNELKPQHLATIQQDDGAIYYDLSSVPKWV